MPGSLDKISDDELAPGDVRKRRFTIKKLVALYNALLNFSIRFDTGKNALTISEGNAVLELDIPALSTAAAVSPDFSLYDASTSTGGTTTLKVGIRVGSVTPKVGLSFAEGTDSRPDVFTAGNHYTHEFVVSSGGRAYLHLTANVPTDGTAPTITGNTISQGSSVPADSETHGYLELGSWSVVAGKLTILSGLSGVGSQCAVHAGGFLFWRA